MRLVLAAIAAIMGLAVFSQTGNTADKKSPDFKILSPSDLSLIHTLSPLPPLPADPTNKYADFTRCRNAGAEALL